MSAPRSYSLTPDPFYGERAIGSQCVISGAQNLSDWSKFLPGHWALGLQKLGRMQFHSRA